MYRREIPQRVKDIVANLFLEDMKQQFPEGFAFGPVIVEGDAFMDGYPCLKVTIVYEDDLSWMDAKIILDRLGCIIDKMAEEGIEEFPVTYFSEKSAWESRNRGQKKDAGG